MVETRLFKYCASFSWHKGKVDSEKEGRERERESTCICIALGRAEKEIDTCIILLCRCSSFLYLQQYFNVVEE